MLTGVGDGGSGEVEAGVLAAEGVGEAGRGMVGERSAKEVVEAGTGVLVGEMVILSI
jgi:hypothetical protein